MWLFSALELGCAMVDGEAIQCGSADNTQNREIFWRAEVERIKSIILAPRQSHGEFSVSKTMVPEEMPLG